MISTPVHAVLETHRLRPGVLKVTDSADQRHCPKTYGRQASHLLFTWKKRIDDTCRLLCGSVSVVSDGGRTVHTFCILYLELKKKHTVYIFGKFPKLWDLAIFSTTFGITV